MKKIFALLITLLLPVTSIAEEFGSTTLVAYRMDHDGVVSEYLEEYAQPLGIISEDSGLCVELLDALFLDKAVAIAWTVENTGTEPLYIIDACLVGGTNMISFSRGFRYDALPPGEKRKCGIVGFLRNNEIRADMEKGTQIALLVSGSRLLGEVVDRDDILASMPQQGEFDYLAFDQEVSRLFSEENKLVFSFGGHLEPGMPDPSFQFDEDSAVPYAAQRYIHTGMLALESLVSIDAPLRRDTAIRSIMPDEPIETTIGGGVVRLTKAMLSPLGLIVEASFIFPDKETALAFYDGNRSGGPLPVTMIDALGMRARATFKTSGFLGASDRFSAEEEEPIEQEDGTYVWHYICEQWYPTSEADTFYLLLDTSKLSEDGIYMGDLVRDADVIRLSGSTRSD